MPPMRKASVEPKKRASVGATQRDALAKYQEIRSGLKKKYPKKSAEQIKTLVAEAYANFKEEQSAPSMKVATPMKAAKVETKPAMKVETKPAKAETKKVAKRGRSATPTVIKAKKSKSKSKEEVELLVTPPSRGTKKADALFTALEESPTESEGAFADTPKRLDMDDGEQETSNVWRHVLFVFVAVLVGFGVWYFHENSGDFTKLQVQFEHYVHQWTNTIAEVVGDVNAWQRAFSNQVVETKKVVETVKEVVHETTVHSH